MRRNAFAIGLVLGLTCFGAVYKGCTAAQVETDVRSAGARVLGLLTLAQNNPAVVEEVKAGLQALATKVDPEDAPKVALALAHVNAGKIAEATTITTAVVSALPQAPVTSTGN